MKELLKVTDVEKILNISRTAVYQLVHRPDFPKIRFGRAIRVSRAALAGAASDRRKWRAMRETMSDITAEAQPAIAAEQEAEAQPGARKRRPERSPRSLSAR